MGIGERIGVVDAASTIALTVHQHDDMLVGRASQHIVHLLEMEGGEITGTVEGVEVCAKGCVPPDALARFADTAFCRRRHDCNHIEAVLHLTEGFVRKERFHRYLAVFKESAHLVLLIALCHVGHMDATRSVCSLLKCDIRRNQTLASLADQDIRRIDGMRHRGKDAVVIVAQFNGDVNGLFGVGY